MKGFMLLAVSVGMIIGATVLYTNTAGSPFTGIPREEVVEMKGVCTKDSSVLSKDRSVLSLAMQSVSDRRKTTTSASGIVTAFLDSERPIYRGEEIILTGRFGTEAFFWGTRIEPETRRFTHPLDNVRYRMLSRVQRKLRSYDAASAPLFEALFLGVKDDLGTIEADLFKKAGCTHILALSGMHLGILSGLLFLVFKPLTGKKGTFCIVTVIVIIYIALTGFRSSLVRAGMMFFLYGLGTLLRNKADIRSVFFASFMMLTVITPRAVYTLSFQLSFLALGGILFIAPAVHRFWKSYVPDIISLPVSASLGAQTATAPVIASVFGTIYPVGILSSLVLTPIISLFMVCGMIAVLVPFPSVGNLFFVVIDRIYAGILWILRGASAIPAIHVGSGGVQNILWFGTALCIFIPAAAAFRYRKQYTLMMHNGAP